jgi:hypothetical protein
VGAAMVDQVKLELWWRQLTPEQQRGWLHLHTDDAIPPDLYALLYAVMNSGAVDSDQPATPPVRVPPSLSAFFVGKREEARRRAGAPRIPSQPAANAAARASKSH